MPALSNHVPQRPQVVNSDDILAQAVPVTSLRESYARVCIYGRNRSGKTTMACMFPKPLLLVSFEPDENGGALSVNDMKDVSLIRLNNSNHAVLLANQLAKSNKFKTVVIDTVTSLQDIALVEMMRAKGLLVPEVLSFGIVPDGMYQDRAAKLRETLRPYLELNNCFLVVLAQEKDHNAVEDRSGKTKILHTMQQGSFMAPALGATNAQWLQDHTGYVMQLYEDEVTEEITTPPIVSPQGIQISPATKQIVGTGKRARHLRLLYHPNFAGGGRWSYNRSTPEFVTAPTPKELYEKMSKYIPSIRV